MDPLEGLRASRPSALDPPSDPDRKSRTLRHAFTAEPVAPAQLKHRRARRRAQPALLAAFATASIVITIVVGMNSQHPPPVNNAQPPAASAASLPPPRDLTRRITLPPSLIGGLQGGARTSDPFTKIPQTSYSTPGRWRGWQVHWAKGRREIGAVEVFSGQVTLSDVVAMKDIRKIDDFVADLDYVKETKPVAMPEGHAVMAITRTTNEGMIIWEREPGLVIVVTLAKIDGPPPQAEVIEVAQSVRIG